MVNNKQVEWSYWICCLVLFGCSCYLSFFEEENDREGESSFDEFVIKNRIALTPPGVFSTDELVGDGFAEEALASRMDFPCLATWLFALSCTVYVSCSLAL
jgi:hypothetical protein